MLSSLSYLNLIAAVLYFLVYLQNGSSWPVAGLLCVIVFNWMTLRSMERGQAKWSVLQWFLSFLSLLYALFLLYSAGNLTLGAINYHYFPLNSSLLVVSGLLFAVLIILQLFLGFREIVVKKSH